jgi:arginyl-tRNA--protein-N-Asp/Glu arginylyltransferase
MSVQGRQREYAVFGCSRSAEILSRPKLATCERLLSLSLAFSAA